ncbi:hypothetical protein ACOME3_008632 [Neoechinorhynchus agilis]
MSSSKYCEAFLHRVSIRGLVHDLEEVLEKFGEVDECVMRLNSKDDRKSAIIRYERKAASHDDADCYYACKSKIYTAVPSQESSERKPVTNNNEMSGREKCVKRRGSLFSDTKKRSFTMRDIPVVEISDSDLSKSFLICEAKNPRRITFSSCDHIKDLIEKGSGDWSMLPVCKDVRLGDICLGREGDFYHRVEVTGVNESGRYDVFIIDNSQKGEIDPIDLRKLNDEWISIPYKMYKMSIVGSEYFNSEIYASKNIKGILESRSFELTYISSDKSCFDGVLKSGRRLSHIVAQAICTPDKNELTSTNSLQSFIHLMPDTSKNRKLYSDMSDDDSEQLIGILSSEHSTIRGTEHNGGPDNYESASNDTGNDEDEDHCSMGERFIPRMWDLNSEHENDRHRSIMARNEIRNRLVAMKDENARILEKLANVLNTAKIFDATLKDLMNRRM